MEESFEQFKKTGKNDVDGLIAWMQKSNIIQAGKEEVEKIKKMFQGCDQSNVSLEKFKEVLERVAKDTKKTTEEVHKSLASNAMGVIDEMKAEVGNLAALGAAGASTMAEKLTGFAEKLGKK